MKREPFAFLLGGIAFGFLFGFGTYHAWFTRPDGAASTATGPPPSPAGPQAMVQGPPAAGGGSAAPMVEEIQALRKRLADDPKDREAAVRLAHMFHDVSMWAQAIEYYRMALAAGPEDPDLLTDQGVCHQELQQYEEAVRLFDRAQRASPGHWQSLYNLAVVQGFRLGRYAEAEGALEKLEAVQPDLPQLAALKEALAEQKARAATKAAS